jgi:cytochrome c-type biogenesis protein CcmF
MLLWVTVWGSRAARGVSERRLAERTLIATLGAQALIALGFLRLSAVRSNPFARLTTAPAEGRG